MGQADSSYLQAWHLFIGDDGQLSTDRAAARVTVGALRSGRVRLIVPEGLDLAPDVAAKIAAYVGEAVLIAREYPDGFRPMPEQRGVTSVGATLAGMVRVSIPEDLDMVPQLAEAIARHIAEAATTANMVRQDAGPTQLQEGQQQ